MYLAHHGALYTDTGHHRRKFDYRYVLLV